MAGRGSPSLHPAVKGPARLALMAGALGVVFGDIGTSPIYTLQTVFDPGDPHPVPVSTDNVYGVVSLVFWSVVVVVLVTYVLLAMRADNEGVLDLDRASSFLSKIELRRGTQPTMASWRKRLFIATSYITADAAEHFGLPRDRTVIMGSHIEV
ncbi:KUP/HAK/KT family potassium transporter [Kitasatospora cineracea]|uniref:KUP/HAK/KT family potassium transporter n=1 Tax=Kitasatospora cineracea TaxID=88074 RepID=UPI0037A1C91B